MGGSGEVFHDGGTVDDAGESTPTSAGTSTARTRFTGLVEEEDRIELVRFSKRIQLFSGDLLRVLAEQLGYGWDGVGFVIVEGAIDPNMDRHALTERVAHGSVNPNVRNAGELATIRLG